MFLWEFNLKAAESNVAEALKAFSAGNANRARQCYVAAAKEYRKAANLCHEREEEFFALADKYDALSYDPIGQADLSDNSATGQSGVRTAADKPESDRKRADFRKVTAEEVDSSKFEPMTVESISFADVAGLEDVKEEVRYKVLEPLKRPDLAEIYDIKPGAKLLLYGPPGTGKTYVARAIAGEVNAVFYPINCSDIISKYVGDSSRNLNSLFDKALKNERVIIFFDEFDSVASKRSDSTSGADAEMARTVATLLALVDGVKKSESNKMLLLIAATNRPWAIDPAMLRGGRFDTHIYVGLPDQQAREFLVAKTLAKLPLDSDVNLVEIAKRLDGYGGGDITAICERIKFNGFMRASQMGGIQKVTKEDCDKEISASRNLLKKEELEKFEKFRKEGSV